MCYSSAKARLHTAEGPPQNRPLIPIFDEFYPLLLKHFQIALQTPSPPSLLHIFSTSLSLPSVFGHPISDNGCPPLGLNTANVAQPIPF